MDDAAFDYLQPTDGQIEAMNRLREAARNYAEILDEELPEGPDKTSVMRQLRTTAMWANVSLTRLPDGSPRR